MTAVNKIKLLLAGIIMLIVPGTSFADHWDHHGRHNYYRYHERPHCGWHVSYLPEVCFNFSLGGMRYFYYDGLYYRRVDRDYVIVEPPTGAVVRIIPQEFRTVVVNGVTYYTDNATYYVYTRDGYQVVPPPVVVTQQVVTQQMPVSPMVITQNPTADETFTVNIPNEQGGYTGVVIKRSGSGFTGPQGEYYPEFPKVSQLQVMYGKK